MSGFCYGCARTDEEKQIWKDEATSYEWKQNNLKMIIERMEGWQLETFKESYKHKVKKGISLFKKKQMENRKL